MKKGDFIIIAVVVLLSVASAFVFLTGNSGERVVITQNGEQVYEGSIFEENILDLGGSTVVIAGGRVSVTKADCKNQICVNHAAVSKKGESIVCLPNSVIIEIK